MGPDDGLQICQGVGQIVVDHQIIIPMGLSHIAPAPGQPAGQFFGRQFSAFQQTPLWSVESGMPPTEPRSAPKSGELLPPSKASTQIPAEDITVWNT